MDDKELVETVFDIGLERGCGYWEEGRIGRDGRTGCCFSFCFCFESGCIGELVVGGGGLSGKDG